VPYSAVDILQLADIPPLAILAQSGNLAIFLIITESQSTEGYHGYFGITGLIIVTIIDQSEISAQNAGELPLAISTKSGTVK
jgi:hypothetical protein